MNYTPSLLGIALLAIIVYVIYRAFANTFGGRGAVKPGGRFVCPACGTRGEPRRHTKGSLLLEILLWLCFIIPGLIYSIWRMSSRVSVCPACGATMIPADTPRGRQLTS